MNATRVHRQRRLLSLVVASLALSAASIGGALAQNCPGLPAPGSLVFLPAPTWQLFPDGHGPMGDNLIEIPAFSPVNGNPSGTNPNGFQQICAIFGLAGSPSGLYQIDARTGTITSFVCDQPIPPRFQPCQGVLIRPVGVPEPILGQIPLGEAPPPAPGGVEGSWPYASYCDRAGTAGDNLFGIPLSIRSTSPADLCVEMSLPDGSSIIRVDAHLGVVDTHLCGSSPTFALVPGEAVIIRPYGCDVVGQVTID